MPRRIIEKELVCSECGAPLRRQKVTAAAIDRSVAVGDDDPEDDLVSDDQEVPIIRLVEKGPVCARCADYR